MLIFLWVLVVVSFYFDNGYLLLVLFIEMVRFYLEIFIKDNKIVIFLDDFNLCEVCLFVFEMVNL